jgi:autotransporter-associated beta strand protein
MRSTHLRSSASNRRTSGALSTFFGKAIAIVTSVAMIGGQSAHAALLAGWDFQTTTNGGTAVLASPATPKLYTANFGSGSFFLDGSNGSSDWFVPAVGTTGTELNGFGGSATNTAGTDFSTVTTSPAALALIGGGSTAPGVYSANGKFAVFTFSMAGYQDLVVSYACQRTNSGFTSQFWDYSTDGVSWTSAQTVTSIASSFSSGSGQTILNTITGLNNVATAYLRFSGTGATSATGNNRFDNFQFNVSNYVQPSGTATWTGNGSGGTWADGVQGHFAAPYSGDLGTTVIFTGTGETATISGAVQAGKVLFEPTSDNYTVTGGSSLELGVSTNVSVAAGTTATINSPLVGSNGLTKGGTGTLVLGGANTFTGGVTVSQGTLQIASDAALGDAANGLNVAGTLKTTGDVTLGASRSIIGSAALDIAAGSKLTISGSAGLSSTSLTNSGTLDLQGSSRSLGGITFAGPSTITGAGSIGVSAIAAGAVTSGTAVIGPAVAFSSGDRSIDVGTGGTVLLAGPVEGGSGTRLVKTGGGILLVPDNNTTNSFRIGVSGAVPTNGGTVILGSSASSGTASQIQLNYGTLETSTAATFPNGLSIGGRTGAVAVLGGSQPMTFSGSTGFFRGTSTSGELRLDANNTTTIFGTLGPTGGSGTATGVTIGGTGRLILAATNVTSGTTFFSDRLTVNSGATVEIANETVLGYSSLNTSGGGTITFGVPAATVASIQGIGTLALKDTSNAPIVLTLSQTTSGTYAGGFSGPGSVVKNGDSTLSLTGASTHTGTTSVQQGVLQIANGSALGASTLAVANSATASVANYIVAGAGGLDLAADGLLDLTAGGLTIGNASAVAIVARIIEGRGDGSWTGTKGITSSVAAADVASSIPRAVGWLDNGDGSVTAAFAAPGDTNLDWQVDVLDASNFLSFGKFDSGLAATWLEGDFNYDGVVDVLDAADFFGTGLYDAGNYNTPPASTGGIAAVPEPSLATAGLLAVGVSLLLARRQRSRV